MPPKKKKAKKSSETLALVDARTVAARNQPLATSFQNTVAAIPPVSPTDRLSFALVITNNHYRAQTADDFKASIVESLDEPFEVQNMLFALNTVEGPWADAHSNGALRWLPVAAADLKPLKTVSDFVGVVFVHLTPHTPGT